MATGFKMVRIPDELAERITATGHKREPFVREAVEAALSGSAQVPAPSPERGKEPISARSPQVERAREAAPSRAPRSGIDWETEMARRKAKR